MANLFGLDTDALLLEHFPELVRELESWADMTSDDDSGEGKAKDIRTVVRESAESYDDDGAARERVANMVTDMLEAASGDEDEASFASYLFTVVADAAAVLNERAKYLHKLQTPDTVDVDSDLIILHEKMSERRDGINQLLNSGDYTPHDVEKKGKRTKGIVTVGNIDVPVTIGTDSQGKRVLTVDRRLPNRPGTGTPGRKVQSSNLRFTVNGDTFTPMAGVAAEHLAWKINSLGGNVPTKADDFITHVQSVTGTDYFADWEAEFDDVSVTCRKV